MAFYRTIEKAGFVLPDGLGEPLATYVDSIRSHSTADYHGGTPPHLLIIGPQKSGKSTLAELTARSTLRAEPKTTRRGRKKPEQSLVIRIIEESDLYSEVTTKIIDAARKGNHAVVVDGFDVIELELFQLLNRIKDFGVPVIVTMDPERMQWINAKGGAHDLFPFNTRLPTPSAEHLSHIVAAKLEKIGIRVTERMKTQLMRVLKEEAESRVENAVGSTKKGDAEYSCFAAIKLFNFIHAHIKKRLKKNKAAKKATHLGPLDIPRFNPLSKEFFYSNTAPQGGEDGPSRGKVVHLSHFRNRKGPAARAG